MALEIAIMAALTARVSLISKKISLLFPSQARVGLGIGSQI